nr:MULTISPECIES: TetR/AcrR family transcriptional regulator [unclassified Schaalia]
MRREEIIRRAAYDLILEKGYSHVTMDDIAEQAGVSRRTVFNYFPSKAETLGFLPQPVSAEEITIIEDEHTPLYDCIRRCLALRFSRIALESTYFRHVKDILKANPEVKIILDQAIHTNVTSLRQAFATRFHASSEDITVLAAVHLMQTIEGCAVVYWCRAMEQETEAETEGLIAALDMTLDTFRTILTDNSDKK